MPNNSKPTKPGGKHAVRAARDYQQKQRARAKANRDKRAK